MKRIKAIEFSVLGPHHIRKMSALEIKNPETYDKDGYPMEFGLMDPHLGVINPGLRCKTCGQKMRECPGHFGHIELVRPVIHAEFSKYIEQLLHAVCFECGRILLPNDKLEKFRSLLKEGADVSSRIIARTKKVRKCPHCGAEKGVVFLDRPTNFFYNKERLYPTRIREILEKISDKDLELFGYDCTKLRPEWFVLTVLQVPPITIRPSITLESGVKSEDDLTHKLVDIIRINLRLKDNIEAGAPQLIIEDLWDLLQYHVTTYFNNNTAGVPPAKHRSGRALRTLVQRLKGKKGRFRYNLTGKRVNFAARTVISPDPNLSINELGVPEEIANEMTVPEYVTESNIEKIKKMIKKTDNVLYIVRPNGLRKKITEQNKNEAAEEIEPGFKIERKLMDGDIVLFNRQPSLHRISMMAHRVKIMKGKTFRFNPIVAKPYNADFDGDEMNMHVPQTEEGKTEARELMFVQDHVISQRYGAPVIILDEDGVSGAYILTLPNTKFSRSEAIRLLHLAGITELPAPDAGDEYSGRLIFSQLLPKDLNLEYKTNTCHVIQKIKPCKECVKEKCKYNAFLKIKNGELLCGVIDSRSLGEGKGILVDTLAKEYGAKAIAKFYDRMARITAEIVTKFGVTVGLGEYETSDAVKRVKAKAIAEMHEKAAELEKQYRKGTLELIPGRNLEESFEIKMMLAAAEAKNTVEKQIMDEKITELFSDRPTYDTKIMILSGSRGSVVNLTNISGLWGQASVREGRPKRGYKERVISANTKGDVGMTAGGFIANNFIEGLTAKEYFFHSMGGRQGEVDTGVSTKVSGYLYRRLANSLKDLVVNNDMTVRTPNKNIIQFIYGEDGVFPQHTSKGKSVLIDAELRKMKTQKGA